MATSDATSDTTRDATGRAAGGRDGQIVTFYSFKGGTGRSMALANVAWILAANGKRVLVADWDLESPGLHRFFKPFLDTEAVRNAPGVIDIIRRYETEARTDRKGQRPANWQEEFARLASYVRSIDWRFPNGGTLDFLSAGRQNRDYSVVLGGMDWTTFYDRLRGAEFFDVLRTAMKQQYDVTLIDSRTGLNDVADICTLHLPDTLVTCFTLSDQGIDGAAAVAQDVRGQRKATRVLPVTMRVDPAEKDRRDAGRAYARRAFTDLPEGLSIVERDEYWAGVEVPYQAFYAYEETLATFGDTPGSPGSLLAAYEKLTHFITSARPTSGKPTALPAMPEDVRLRILDQYRRPMTPPGTDIAVEYAAADQPWAEWVERVLTAVDVKVVDLRPLESRHDLPARDQSDQQLLTILSSATPPGPLEPRLLQAAVPRLAVQVSAGHSSRARFTGTVNLATLDADQAEEAAVRVLSLVGRTDSPKAEHARKVGPFPRREPLWFGSVPARNAQFTGRADVLWELRDRFRQGNGIVALVGMGGIGKTQLAVEYTHRFRSSYELVWWIRAASLNTVEGAVEDLAQDTGIPLQAERSRTLSATLDALRRGSPTDEWLLVLDNSEDPHELGPLLARQLPSGPGHVLVTTRSTDWGQYATALPVPLFHREESTYRLRGQVDALTEQDADAVASAMGDLPLALDAAIGSLRGGAVSVREYLDQLAASATIDSAGVGRELQATFGVALDRLREQSPGAHRLLELLSLMAPEISLEFIFGDAMAAALAPFDRSVSDRTMRQPLLERLERFSLVTVDTRERQVVVHRLLQEFVRGRMPEDARSAARHQVHQVLANGKPSAEVDDPKLWPAFRKLWPHLTASGAAECPDPDVRQLLIDRIRYLWLRGDWHLGEDFGREVAQRWEDTLAAQGASAAEQDPFDPGSLRRQLLRLRLNLANILRDRARFAEALEMDKGTLDELTRLLGDHHAQTLLVAAGYAADLRAAGDYGEALERERETTRLWSEHFGVNYPPALSAANNLAVSLRAVGQFAEARDVDQRAYARRTEILGPDHPRTLDSANAIGRDLRETGDYQASVDWLRDVVAHAVRTSEGREGPAGERSDRIIRVVLAARTNLATSLRSAGHPDQAEPEFEDAYQQLRQFMGPDAPSTLACRLNRAVNMFLLEHVTDAAHELQGTADAYERALGPNHPLRLICLSNLSVVRRKQGTADAARRLASEAVEGCARVLGDEHPFTLAARMNLAICLDGAGDAAGAAAEMGRAAQGLRTMLGPDHPDSLLGQVSHQLLLSAVEGSRSSPGAQFALQELASRLGEDHPTVRDLRKGTLVHRLIDPSDPF
jgi:tetratricopeptide (TPR) repeat protein